MLIYTDDFYNAPDPDIDVDQLRAEIRKHIDSAAVAKRIKIAGEPSPEYASWGIKLAEANAGGGPLLQVEADARGVSLSAIVNRVLSNSAAYQQAEAYISGTAGKHKDAISLLTTREDLLAYDWRF